jgi:hypothetical protein
MLELLKLKIFYFDILRLLFPRIKKYLILQISSNMFQTSLFSLSIDAHGLKIQGTGSLKFLPKSLGGGGFREKLPGGVPLFRVL